MHELDSGIFYEDGYPGVTVGAIVQKQGTLMIDAPLLSDDVRSWKATLLHQGIGIHRLLVNLDIHHDRVLGNRAMSVNILSHTNTAQAFQNRPTVFKGNNEEMGAEWENFHEIIGTRWSAPNLTFTKHLNIHWSDPPISVEHHPGPAPGAAWVVVPKSKIVFVGDAVVPNQPPFFAEANIPAWIEALDLLISSEFKDFQMISGRGGPVTIQDARAQRRYLKTALQKLERLAKRNAEIEKTERLIKSLLSPFDIPSNRQYMYEQRLRYGLSHYYQNHYYQEETEEE